MEHKQICPYSQPYCNIQPCYYTTIAVDDNIRSLHVRSYWHYCPSSPCYLLTDPSHLTQYLHLSPEEYEQYTRLYVIHNNNRQANGSAQQQVKQTCPNVPCPYDDVKEHKEKYWHQCMYGKHCKELASGNVVHLSRFKHDLEEPMKDMCADGYACRQLSREHLAHKNGYMHICKKGPLDCTNLNDPVHKNRFVHVNTPFDNPDKTTRYWDPIPPTNANNYMLVNIPNNT